MTKVSQNWNGKARRFRIYSDDRWLVACEVSYSINSVVRDKILHFIQSQGHYMIGLGLMVGKIWQPIGKHDQLLRHGEDEQMLPGLTKSQPERECIEVRAPFRDYT